MAGVAAGNIRGTKTATSSDNLGGAMEELAELVKRARKASEGKTLDLQV
jgi:hypothetical protein